MNSVTGPGIIDVQTLIDEQGFIKLIGQSHCIFQGIVILKTPVDLHPIENVIPVRIWLFIISTEFSVAVYILHNSLHSVRANQFEEQLIPKTEYTFVIRPYFHFITKFRLFRVGYGDYQKGIGLDTFN